MTEHTMLLNISIANDIFMNKEIFFFFTTWQNLPQPMSANEFSQSIFPETRLGCNAKNQTDSDIPQP